MGNFALWYSECSLHGDDQEETPIMLNILYISRAANRIIIMPFYLTTIGLNSGSVILNKNFHFIIKQESN